jgi:hypothetical protein
MKKIMFAAALASAALFGLSVQAAPLTSPASVVETQAATGDAVQKVWYHGRHRSHWRWGSRGGGGWGGGWGHNRHRSHWRWGSRGRW